MRFVSYAAGLIVAALIVLAPAARVKADMIDLTITDGSKTYTTGFGDSFTGVSLPTFTLDGVTIKGATAVATTTGGDAINFNTSSVSGTETSGKTITITVTDKAFPAEVTSFQTAHGYSIQVGGSSVYQANSTVSSTSDASTTASTLGGGTLGGSTTVAAPNDPTLIVLSASLSGFSQYDGVHPSISAATVLTVPAVPEPNAFLIGVLGLPCMGAVVYFARRRSAAMAAMVA
jgi:hypothetical protein